MSVRNLAASEFREAAASTNADRPVRMPISCRPIVAADLDVVVDLLATGFPERSRAYWHEGLNRYASVGPPGDNPRIGFLLIAGGRAVGVILTLHYRATWGAEAVARCNLSSWYVEPGYATYAPLLDMAAARQRDVTFFNISALRRTWPMHEARGFRRYGCGQFVAVPLLSRPRSGVRIRSAATPGALDDLPAHEQRIVRDHAGFGCVCLVATDGRGSEPFVFIRRPGIPIRRLFGWRTPSYYQLVYCRSAANLPRFAHALGRHLLRTGAMPWVMIDATGPLPGLTGLYVDRWGTRLERGPASMRLGDLAYSELVLFGP